MPTIETITITMCLAHALSITTLGTIEEVSSTGTTKDSKGILPGIMDPIQTVWTIETMDHCRHMHILKVIKIINCLERIIQIILSIHLIQIVTLLCKKR